MDNTLIDNEKKMWLIITVVTVSLLVIIFAGLTYAFFTTSNNDGSTAEVISDSGKMTITYGDGTNNIVVASNISPSNDLVIADKTFTVTGTNTTSGLIMPFKIYLEYQNTFSRTDLRYFLKRTDTSEKVVVNVIDLYDIGEITQEIIDEYGMPQELLGYYENPIDDWSNNPYSQEIASGYFKVNSDGVAATFSLKMMFLEMNRNQDYNKGAVFNGKIVINNDIFTTVVDTVDRQLLTQNNNNFTTKIYNDSSLDKNVRFTQNSFLLNSTSTVSNNNVNYKVSDLSNSKTKSYDYRFLAASGGYDYNDSNNINIFGLKGFILGTFNVKNVDTGKYERMLKIMLRYNVGVSFNTIGNNDWENSSLMKELNSDTHLNEYYNYYKDMNLNQISDSYDGVIANVEWDVGGVSNLNVSLDNAYSMERGLGTYTSNKKTWTGKIGLPSLSDLLYYKMNNSNCFSNISNCNKVDDENFNFLTITKNLNNNSEIYSVDSQGNFKSLAVTVSSYSFVYETFYLKSDIAFACGDGSLNNPYAISKDECKLQK